MTGRIDLCLLAADATREENPPIFDDPPAWIADLPNELPDASPVELARIDAEARRKYLHSGEY